MEHGELPDSATRAGARVALVLTQGWCPQWYSMNIWLDAMEKRGEPAEWDIIVYELVYDRVEFFDQFRTFKEHHFRNYQIPYIRYYRDGTLIGDSNYVPSHVFLDRLS